MFNLRKTDLVMSSRHEGDKIVFRVAQFFGPSQWQIDLMADLEHAGYRVEAQDVPGLWRINGGPGLTTNQLIGEARRLLA